MPTGDPLDPLDHELCEDEDDDELPDDDPHLDPYGAVAALADIPADLIELHRIPPRLWEETLAPLPRQQRYWVAHQIPDERLKEVASTLAFELDMADGERRRARDEARFEARRTGHPLPQPGAGHTVNGPTVQVNVRLRRDDHARLTRAAATAGLKPTTLARALILNGAAKILREHGGSEDRPSVRRRTPGYP